MANIGEHLEEARKRKGVSIREAAEVTKIRGDFLEAFETNRFGDVNLPDIYKRGFIKIYSTFLKLNPEQVLADYTAHQLGNSRLPRREGREFLGRIDLPASRLRQQDEPAAPDKGSPRATSTADPEEQQTNAPYQPDQDDRFEEQPERPKQKRRSHFSDPESGFSPFGGDKSLYWKIGLAGGGAFVLFLLIFALIKAIGGGSSETTPTPINEPLTQPRTTPAETGGSELILVGTGEVFVQVKQLDNGEILYKGTLGNGERVPLRIRGDADIAFTRGSNLQIIKDGETFQPDVSRSELGKVNTRNL